MHSNATVAPDISEERLAETLSDAPLPPLVAFAKHWGFAPDSPMLQLALTHTSAAATVADGNERLEFLGDALLSAFVARYLYTALPPDTREGVLSRGRVQVVRKETLASVGRRIGIPELLTVGQGERKEQRNERDSLIADAYEAVVAALYLEVSEEAMNHFLNTTLRESLESVTSHPPDDDPKTRLQIVLQASGRGLPQYETMSETSTGEHHHFIVAVFASDGVELGQGEGASKRTAQRNAAQNALAELLSDSPVSP